MGMESCSQKRGLEVNLEIEIELIKTEKLSYSFLLRHCHNAGIGSSGARWPQLSAFRREMV